MRRHTSVVVKEAVGSRSKIGSRFRLTDTQLPTWAVNKAQVLAIFEDQSAAIIANKFGKGMVVSFFTDAWTASRDLSNLTRDVLDYALKANGAGSQVDIVGGNENIDIAVGQTLEGFTAALVNHNSNRLDVSLKPTKSASPGGQWVDLVTGNKIPSAAQDNSVKLTINGSAVRVVEFRRSAAN